MLFIPYALNPSAMSPDGGHNIYEQSFACFKNKALQYARCGGCSASRKVDGDLRRGSAVLNGTSEQIYENKEGSLYLYSYSIVTASA